MTAIFANYLGPMLLGTRAMTALNHPEKQVTELSAALA